MKNPRLFGHFDFVYSKIFTHASGMQNVSKLRSCYLRKTTAIFVLNTRLYEALSIFILFFWEDYILNSKFDSKSSTDDQLIQYGEFKRFCEKSGDMIHDWKRILYVPIISVLGRSK